jgi:hypothetical protein
MTLRSSMVIGTLLAALAVLVPTTTVFAQGRLGDPTRPSLVPPRPDFPGAKQPEESSQPGISNPSQPGTPQSPRSDSPAAKQGDNPSQK